MYTVKLFLRKYRKINARGDLQALGSITPLHVSLDLYHHTLRVGMRIPGCQGS